MRKLLATVAGVVAATAVLWEAGTVGRFDSMTVGAAVVAGYLAAKAARYVLGGIAEGHRKVGRIIANSEGGRPLFTGDPDEMLIAHAKRWGAEV